MSTATFTRWTRLALAGQVAVLLVLALAAVLLVIEVSERPGLRIRLDLTETGSSSLDPATVGVIQKLPTAASIDVFFRPTPEIDKAPTCSLTRSATR